MTSENNNLVNLIRVQHLVIERKTQVNSPGKEDRSCSDNPLTFLAFRNSVRKPSIFPQRFRIRRAVIQECGMLLNGKARFHLRSFAQRHGGPQEGCLERLARNAWNPIEQIETTHPFETANLLVIGFRLFAFVRDLFLGFRPFVQRIAQLAIVHQERCHPGQVVLHCLLQKQPPCKQSQTHTPQKQYSPLAQVGLAEWQSVTDVDDQSRRHDKEHRGYSSRAAVPFLCAHRCDGDTQDRQNYRRAHNDTHPAQRLVGAGLANKDSNNGDHFAPLKIPNKAEISKAYLSVTKLN